MSKFFVIIVSSPFLRSAALYLLPYYTIYARKIPYNNNDKKSDGYPSNCKFFSTVSKGVFTNAKKYAIIGSRIMKGVHLWTLKDLTGKHAHTITE